MSKRQEQGGVGIKVTPRIKALAGRCVAKGLTWAEITDISDEVRAEVATYLRRLGVLAESGKPRQDIVEEDPRLTRFADQYRCFSEEDKTRCPWQRVRKRLLKNNGRYLALAQGLNSGGILFGVDKQENPLFADDGKEPIMTDMNYGDTRNAVYLKDPQGEWVDDNMTGYEMFPYAGGQDEYDKSPEILAFERFTGKPFVVSPDRKEWRSSWLESGMFPARPRNVDFAPDFGTADVSYRNPGDHNPRRGVRRLLRVKES